MAATPRPVVARPATSRRRLDPELSTATSRIAAMGATFAARRAGMTAEATLTPRPATSAASTVPPVTTTLPAGRSMPIPLRPALRPTATPMPATSPAIDATRPTATDSTSTEPSTCRRLAPTARSIAISLVRWATRTEKEL